MNVFGECFVTYAVCCLICVVIFVRQYALPHSVFLLPLALLDFWFQFSVFKPFETEMSQESLVLISECLHCVRRHLYFHLHFHFDTEKLPLEMEYDASCI